MSHIIASSFPPPNWKMDVRHWTIHRIFLSNVCRRQTLLLTAKPFTAAIKGFLLLATPFQWPMKFRVKFFAYELSFISLMSAPMRIIYTFFYNKGAENNIHLISWWMYCYKKLYVNNLTSSECFFASGKDDGGDRWIRFEVFQSVS